MLSLALFLLASNPSQALSLESELYPIRVDCPDKALAEQGLALSEAIWEEQVVGMGFATPKMLDDKGQIVDGFRLSVDNMGSSVLATFEIQGDIPETAASDCPILSQLNSVFMDDEEWYSMGIAHLLNHASLHAVDCLEPQMPAFDFFTVAIEQITRRDAYWMVYLPVFQSMPESSLDRYYVAGNSARYQFGASLFMLFLDEHYGAGDGSLLPEIWALCAQDGTILSSDGEFATGDVDNEPDFLDAVEQWLSVNGSSMDQALTHFTEWRYFVGGNDDGLHFDDASEWAGAEVRLDSTYIEKALPIETTSSIEPQGEYSSSYVEIHVQGEEGTLLVDFDGDDAIGWAASVFVLAADQDPVILPFSLDDGQAGRLSVPLDGEQERVILAVTALSDGEHDPEDHDWRGDYLYQRGAMMEGQGIPPQDDTGEGAEDDTDAPRDTAEGGKGDEDSCGCASGAQGSLNLTFLAGFLLLVRRARRGA